MIQILELVEKDFKIIFINMLKKLEDKMDKVDGKMQIFSRKIDGFQKFKWILQN